MLNTWGCHPGGKSPVACHRALDPILFNIFIKVFTEGVKFVGDTELATIANILKGTIEIQREM